MTTIRIDSLPLISDRLVIRRVLSLLTVLLLHIQPCVSQEVSANSNWSRTDNSTILETARNNITSISNPDDCYNNYERSISAMNGMVFNSRKIPLDPTRHKDVYRVGVLAIRGFEAAYNEFNRTFSDYLSLTAGQRYYPRPIRFEMVPLEFEDLFPPNARVDFIYVNPSAYACIESEYTAYSLVSQISRRDVKGNTYELKKFGGVIFTLANNTNINNILDLKQKVIAAASISGLGSGQMQFLEMQNAGMSYVNDPKQLVFTGDQSKVVLGVLDGEFDVGFVRTDQMERTKDKNGNLIDTSLFKIINAKSNLNIDGIPFPFQSSTPLYPEWNVAALDHVPVDVSREVQHALLELSEMVKNHPTIDNNENPLGDTSIGADATAAAQNVVSVCEQEIYQVAKEAMAAGKYAGWQTTLSYMQLRSMQQATKFITFDNYSKTWHCIRASTLYESIMCPDGYYKIDESSFDTICSDVYGLQCQEGYNCVCTPCQPIKICEELEIAGECVTYAFFFPIVILPIIGLLAISVHCYVDYKRRQADAVWVVRPSELKFNNPIQVIGQGTFGLVLLAEYRGTQVAVKRVLPPRKDRKGDGSSISNNSNSLSNGYEYHGRLTQSAPHLNNSTNQSFSEDLDVEGNNPGLKSVAIVRSKRGSMGDGSTPLQRVKQLNYKKQREDFVHEMRHLAKLRHPCITTVMGAIVSRGHEPMLIMEYMTHGSLYDVLRDYSIILDKEQVIQILKDIAQGLRFLHTARPQVIHGDLKAKNVLIDLNFKAKVTDFGLTAKKNSMASGTPFWMAPELLTGKSSNTAESDIYAFGILIYEVYSREAPYHMEDPTEVIRQVCDPCIDARPPVPPACPTKVAKLMQECLLRNPLDRPSAEHIDLSIRVEATVNERTSKLVALNSELAEANKKIASASALQLQHFAMMSHEIRTPLNAIIGISDLLEETELDPSQQESVSMIVSSGRLLKCIVDDVLDFSKLESGNATIEKKPSDLEKIVSECVTAMSSSTIAQQKKIMVKVSFDPDIGQRLNTDSRRLIQVLYNLLSNATKFSDNGGVVELSVTKSVDIETTSKTIRFAVKDFGKGIDKAEFEKIFQPFTQTSTGMNNAHGGTGLGLAITKKLVLALGGTISVDSEVGKWTKFYVDFPLDTVSLVDIRSVVDRLNGAKIAMVSFDPQKDETTTLIDIFAQYHIDFSHYTNMEDLWSDIVTDTPVQKPCICLTHGELYMEDVFKSILSKGKCGLITFGTKFRPDSAHFHYNSLREVLPSNLLQDIGDAVKHLEKANRKFVDFKKPAIQPIETSFANLHILIAEDNKVNQKVLQRLLNRLGVANVQIVENGKLAVEAEATTFYDIIFMDMQMPVMDGIEACRLIVAREDSKHPKPQIIFCTAHVFDSFRSIGMDNGAAGYLTKPVAKNDVKEFLEAAAQQAFNT